MLNLGPIVRAMKHNRTRVALVVLEIAMTLAIVTNCVNVILAERAKMNQKSGFDDDNIVRVAVRSWAPEFRNPAYVDNMLDQDVRTIESVPGVRAAANTDFQLWEGGGSSTNVFAVGGKSEPVVSQVYLGTKDLMQTLGATVVEGRTFRNGDHGTGSQDDPTDKAIITKSVADLLFPGGHAVGKMIQMGKPADPFEKPMTVVGVIRDFYNPFAVENALAPQSDKAIFIPGRLGGRSSAYLIRTEPGAMKPALEELERRLLKTNPGRTFETMSTAEKKGRWFAGDKIVVTTMSCIIVTLVGVTTLGLLGLTSLSVAERTKQIGTRRALGATRADILRHFLVENWIVTTAGLVLGVGGAYALNFALVSHVSDVKMGWQLIAAGVVLLWINGVVATLPPAMRAMMVPPSIATRSV